MVSYCFLTGRRKKYAVLFKIYEYSYEPQRWHNCTERALVAVGKTEETFFLYKKG